MPDGPVEPPSGDGLEARVAVLEQIARSTVAALERIDRRLDTFEHRFDLRFDAIERRIDEGFREIRATHDCDFRLTWAGIITLALGLGALMAHGFHWF